MCHTEPNHSSKGLSFHSLSQCDIQNLPQVHLLTHTSRSLLQFSFSTNSSLRKIYCQNPPKLLFNAAETFFLLIIMFPNSFGAVNFITVTHQQFKVSEQTGIKWSHRVKAARETGTYSLRRSLAIA